MSPLVEPGHAANLGGGRILLLHVRHTVLPTLRCHMPPLVLVIILLFQWEAVIHIPTYM